MESELSMEEFISKPILWPLRPMLPMKRWNKEGRLPEVGYLIEQQGAVIFPYSSDGHQRYESIAAMKEAGWRID